MTVGVCFMTYASMGLPRTGTRNDTDLLASTIPLGVDIETLLVAFLMKVVSWSSNSPSAIKSKGQPVSTNHLRTPGS